jgi:NTE family protein
MARIGLVLGAGGVVGQAFHAGVLAALEHDLGWDPRTADVIVGSSAGSVTGTLLRLGVPAADLAAWAVEAPLSVEGAPVVEALGGEAPDFPGLRARDLLRGWRLPSAALVARTARRPWAFRAMAAASTLLPAGKVDITEKAEALHGVSGDNWPPGLWICAARRRDGGRVVFGRDGSPYAPLGRAVAASCAIPGYFSPVPIGEVEYIDGGVHSPTNADVLRREHLDLVVAVSPMSAYRGLARAVDAPMRWSAHRRLERELQQLRSRGTAVVRFEPGPRTLAAMGLNAMAIDRSDAVVQTAFLEAGRVAARSNVSERLRPLTSRIGRLESLGARPA